MASQEHNTRLVVGCMTGTSLDGLDAVLTRIDGHGLEMRAEFVRMVSRPLGELGEVLRSFAEGEAHPACDFVRAARALGELHADAVAELAGDEKIDFVVAHGQTIFHAGDEHVSWQLFDPWPVVKRCCVPVCYDLRQADLITGGQGAPITPIADWVMYRGQKNLSRSIYNLGGIINVTHLPSSFVTPQGRDIGPCNILLDSIVQSLFKSTDFDEDGHIAAAGLPIDSVQTTIDSEVESILKRNRTLGRDDFDKQWFDEWLPNAVTDHKNEDIVATAVRFIATRIWLEHIDDPGDTGKGRYEIVLAGGGARNAELMRVVTDMFAPKQDFHVITSDELGIPCEAREAMGFAVLGALSQDHVPITLPQVTGAKLPGVAGAWVYP